MTTAEPTRPAPLPPQHARFIDVHYHVGPDAYLRRHTAATAGALYAEHEGWVVLKNHLGSTAAQAWEARQQGLPVSGSIVLNDLAGGFDPGPWNRPSSSTARTAGCA
nr:hypothetical protein [Streptomyces sp. MMG1121]